MAGQWHKCIYGCESSLSPLQESGHHDCLCTQVSLRSSPLSESSSLPLSLVPFDQDVDPCFPTTTPPRAHMRSIPVLQFPNPSWCLSFHPVSPLASILLLPGIPPPHSVCSSLLWQTVGGTGGAGGGDGGSGSDGGCSGCDGGCASGAGGDGSSRC